MGGKPIPKVAQLSQEYAALLAEKQEQYAEYKALRQDMIDYRTMKQNVDKILGLMPEEQEQQRPDGFFQIENLRPPFIASTLASSQLRLNVNQEIDLLACALDGLFRCGGSMMICAERMASLLLNIRRSGQSRRARRRQLSMPLRRFPGNTYRMIPIRRPWFSRLSDRSRAALSWIADASGSASFSKITPQQPDEQIILEFLINAYCDYAHNMI